MIEVYDSMNKNFDYNGDMTLKPIKAELSNSLNNASIELIVEHEKDDLGRYKYLEEDNVIKCFTPWDRKKGQLFRIYETDKDSDENKITAYARHIISDLITIKAKDYSNENILIVYPSNCNGQTAITKLLKNTDFKGYSDIQKIESARWEKKGIIEALLSDDENSFINRWGGELYVDNKSIYMNSKIGGNYGVKISYGKNQKGLNIKTNIEELPTRLIPEGYDGISLTGKTPWVDSKNIGKFAEVREFTVKFDDVKVKENSSDEEGFETIEEAREELIKRCNKLFEEGIDTPSVNINVGMEDLSNTTLYKDYACLEEVNLGDEVIVTNEKFDIDTTTRCISYTWNVITEKYINIELGDVELSYFDKQNDITNKVNNILNKVINDDGSLNAAEIKGFINATNASIKAQKNIAQKQDIRAFLFEDLVEGSDTYGALLGGTKGIMVAEKRTLDNKDWDYSSALTSKGLVANVLYGRILAGEGVYFDLSTGEISFKKGLIKGSNSSWNLDTGEFKSSLPDGSEIVISPSGGFYNKFGNSKREFYHLSVSGEVKMPNFNGEGEAGASYVDITLPNEFKNKSFIINLAPSSVKSPGGGKTWALSNIVCFATQINYKNATFRIRAGCSYNCLDDNTSDFKTNNISINYSVIA
ncbi:MAG: phage tail spike protein [Clostridium sp.]|nr:phage tail protein [Clostridium sp.]